MNAAEARRIAQEAVPLSDYCVKCAKERIVALAAIGKVTTVERVDEDATADFVAALRRDGYTVTLETGEFVTISW